MKRRIQGSKIKEMAKKVAFFFANPRLLLCLAIAWMITNGWSYVMLGLGGLLGQEWMLAVAGTYMAMLWFPFTPEKVLTVIIAILLLKWLFPHDTRTLAVLASIKKRVITEAKAAVRKKKRGGNKNLHFQKKGVQETMLIHICELCGYEYRPTLGDPDNGIEENTDFEDLPEDWVCPLCGAGKEDFTEENVEEEDDEEV